MKIVANACSLLEPLTGIGQYTYQLLKALREVDAAGDYTYYYGFFSREILRKEENEAPGPRSAEQRRLRAFQRFKGAVKALPVIGPLGRSLRTAVGRTALRLAGPRFDLYFEPNFIPLPELRAARVVTMVFDLSVLLYPQWHPRERLRIFDRHFRRGLRRSDVVLTATQFVKGQIVEHLGVAPDRVAVTPIDCNREAFRLRGREEAGRHLAARGVPRSYLLFVGSIEPRKNIMGLLRAYRLLPERLRREVAVVFAGQTGWKNEEVFRFVREHGLEGRLHFTKYVTDEFLGHLYAGAQALVYPSFYEGFGLPPLEAMCCGCPAVISDIPTHREVCGDGALYADPGSPESLAAAVQRVLEEPGLREALVQRGLARAATYSWERTARETLAVFEAVGRGA